MTLRELKQRIDHTLKYSREDEDMDVVVRVSHEGDAGSTPATLVTNGNAGFDWDAGRFILTTSDPIMRTSTRIKQKIMSNAEVKKYLYRNKPTAKVKSKMSTYYLYYADIDQHYVSFLVPIAEMGETPFEDELPAQLLIRWLV
jgi:hypothetical protein